MILLCKGISISACSNLVVYDLLNSSVHHLNILYYTAPGL